MPIAKETFDRMMRDQVAPALRALGMKGSGGRFVLPDPDVHRLVGFQGDYYSTAGLRRFTINLARIGKAEWEDRPAWSRYKLPSANVVHPVGESTRLGAVMGVGDRWWELSADEDPSPLATELVAAIRDHGLPWIRGVPERRC